MRKMDLTFVAMLLFVFRTVIHGHHVYYATWTPKTGQLLYTCTCAKEPANTCDKRAATTLERVNCVVIVILSVQLGYLG